MLTLPHASNSITFLSGSRMKIADIFPKLNEPVISILFAFIKDFARSMHDSLFLFFEGGHFNIDRSFEIVNRKRF